MDEHNLRDKMIIMRMNRNAKGFVFTLDAVFALIVAAVGVSILLYVDFTSSASYALAASEAPAILQSMLRTTASQAFTGSAYLNALSTSSYSASYPWGQFGHDEKLSSGTGFTLQYPYLLYTFNTTGTIMPSVAINQGLVAVASGTKIYLLNATTGSLYETFPKGNPSDIATPPAIGMGMLYYANASDTVRGISLQNPSAQWNFTEGNSIVTPIEIEDNYVVFGTTEGFYILDPKSGSQIAYGNVKTQVQAPVYLDGEYIVPTTSEIYSYSLNGNTLTSTWNAVLDGSTVTQPSSLNGTIAIGSGHYLYIFDLGGTRISKSNDLLSNVLGVSAYDGVYYVQTSNSIYGFTTAGSMQFSSTTETNTGGFTPTPAVGPSTVYTLINGNVLSGYDTGTHSMEFNIALPSDNAGTGYSEIALAYGNMYVPSGNTLYVFGTYKPKQGDSILQSLAEMYLNGQGDYSNRIMQVLYNASTTGIFINGTYAPDLSVATFNSADSSYVEQAGGFGWMDNQSANFTISVWINPTSVNGIVVGELGQRQLTGAWKNGMIKVVDGTIYANISNSAGTQLNLGSVPINTSEWFNIVLTYNGKTGNETGYVDGTMMNSTIITRSVPGGGAEMFYPLGAGLPNDYFSGSMLDYQIYNTTLGSRNITRIYQNGAFAKPVDMKDMWLWLPLVGNSNDFSGKFNFGMPHNIEYTNGTYMPIKLANAYQVSKASVPMLLDVNGSISNYSVSVVIWR